MKNEYLNEIRERQPDFLPVIVDKSGKEAFSCPVCKGALWYHQEANRYNCFRCDLMEQDYINLYALYNGMSVSSACRKLIGERAAGRKTDGIPFSSSDSLKKQKITDNAIQNGNDTGRIFPRAAALKQNLYLNNCKAFLHSRGFEPEEIEKYNIGFAPKFQDYKRPDGSYKTSPRFISYDDTGTWYQIRDIRPDNRLSRAERENKKRSPKGQKKFIFNEAALNDPDRVIFVTEGVFDCLSILVCGFPAVAVNGLNCWHALIDSNGERRYKATRLIICFDYELTTEKREIITKETRKAVQTLTAAGYLVFSGNSISRPYKDINDLFTVNRDKLHDRLSDLERTADNMAIVNGY